MVLIDNGVGLKICTLKLVTWLGYSKDFIDKGKIIIIKAYDDMERNSKGTIRIPV